MSLRERFYSLDGLLAAVPLDMQRFAALAHAVLELGEDVNDAQVAEMADLAAATAKVFDSVSLQCRLELVERRIASGGFDG